MCYWQNYVPCYCKTDVLISCWLSSQGCSQFLEATSVSCHMAFSQILPQYGGWLLHGQEENLFWAFHLTKSGPPRTVLLVINLKSVCFWTSITSGKSFHLCHILWTRSKWYIQPNSMWRDYSRAGSPGIILACVSVQLLSHVQLFLTPWTAARWASLSIISPQSLLKLMSIKSVMPSNHIMLSHPLLFLPSIFPSIGVFSNESVLCIRWPKYWSFSFSISSSNEYSGLTSFRRDWLDLLAVQGTLKSLLQHHSSKASILRCSAFFIVQLSHPHMTIGKTIALTRQTFVGKVMSLLFNML